MHNRAFTFESRPGISFRVMAHFVLMSLDSGMVNASPVAFTAARLTYLFTSVFLAAISSSNCDGVSCFSDTSARPF